MKAAEFKTVVSQTKEALKGKTIKIDFVNGNKVERLSFTSLREFGSAILHLEKIGAGFGFVQVANQYVNKPTPKAADFLSKMNKGVWNEVTFLATTVKL